MTAGRGGYVEAPTEYANDGRPTVFLAGGITGCPDWQAEAADRLRSAGITVFNPRRADFPIHDPAAADAQVDWEFRHLRKARLVLFWFPAGSTVQPIALFELGAHSSLDTEIVVGVDPDYPRGQDVVLQMSHVRAGETVFPTLAGTVGAAIGKAGHV